MRDFAGLRFGRLEVIKRVPGGAWMCRCDCGKFAFPNTGNLKSGNSRSCGCMLEMARVKHGMTGSPEYKVWKAMRSRCNTRADAAYRNYGARGIGVCPEWDDFSMFLRDMGPRPGLGYDLDRIDNDKGYSKENCRWVTHQANLNNRRNSRFIERDGQRKTITQWAADIGMNPRTLNNRINRGWSPERALSEPI